MMIARWHFEARFGHKDAAINSLSRWNEEIGSQIGWTADKTRILTGSIGALESTIQSEILITDLNELNASWSKLGEISAHKEWGKEMEQLIVSGTPRWEIFRVV